MRMFDMKLCQPFCCNELESDICFIGIWRYSVKLKALYSWLTSDYFIFCARNGDIPIECGTFSTLHNFADVRLTDARYRRYHRVFIHYVVRRFVSLIDWRPARTESLKCIAILGQKTSDIIS